MNKEMPAVAALNALSVLKNKELKSKSIVDVFVMNETQKSVSIRTVFEDPEKTLAPETIKDLEFKVIQTLEKAGFPIKA
jgi:phenylalanyl-tRNA synthetase beta chain